MYIDLDLNTKKDIKYDRWNREAKDFNENTRVDFFGI